MIEISIVIPVYNVSNEIEDCVNSVLNQTYTNFEIILVNDGSTDDSLDKCTQLATSSNKIRVINQNNRGVSSARNTGIIEAKGRWVTFIDSDDFVSEEYLENLMQDDVDFVITGICLLNKQIKKNIIPDNIKLVNRIELIDFISKIEGTGYIFNGPCQKRFSLDIIKKYDLKFREDVDYGEDTIFVLNYMKFINTAIALSKVDYFYNIENNDSLSTTITFERRFNYLSKLELVLFDLITYLSPTSCQKQMILYIFIKQVYATILLNYNGNYSYKERQINIELIKELLKQSKWFDNKSFRLINYPMYFSSKYGLNYFGDKLNQFYYSVKNLKNIIKS